MFDDTHAYLVVSQRVIAYEKPTPNVETSQEEWILHKKKNEWHRKANKSKHQRLQNSRDLEVRRENSFFFKFLVVGDNLINMKEQERELASPITHILLRRRTKTFLDRFRKIQEMMFLKWMQLSGAQSQDEWPFTSKQGLTLLRMALRRSRIQVGSYLRNLLRSSSTGRSSRWCQLPEITRAELRSSCLPSDPMGSLGSTSIRSENSWRKVRRLSGVQKKGWIKIWSAEGLLSIRWAQQRHNFL